MALQTNKKSSLVTDHISTYSGDQLLFQEQGETCLTTDVSKKIKI